jgi:tetratricopeptide (TPR) repeat protein
LNQNNRQAKAFLMEISEENFILDEDKPFQSIVKQLFDDAMRFYRKEMYKEADNKLKEAHETDPTNEQVKKYLQIIAEKNNKAKEIEEKDTLLLTADKMRENGDIENAKKVYENVLKIMPDDMKAQFYIDNFNKKSDELLNEAKNLYDTGAKQESYKIVKASLEYNDNNLDAQNLANKLSSEIAGMQNKNEQNKKANKLYNDGVDAFSKGEYEEAIKYWQAVVEINPDDTETQNNIVMAKEKIAETIKKTGKKINDIIAEAKEMFDQGLIEKAQSNFEYVLRIEPDNNTAQAYLANINDIIDKRKKDEINKR